VPSVGERTLVATSYTFGMARPSRENDCFALVSRRCNNTSRFALLRQPLVVRLESPSRPAAVNHACTFTLMESPDHESGRHLLSINRCLNLAAGDKRRP
jgi:hypothetical protein